MKYGVIIAARTYSYRLPGKALLPLGGIPMINQVVEGGDSGVPVLISHPDSPASKAYKSLAGQVAAQLSIVQSKEEKVGANFELAWKG